MIMEAVALFLWHFVEDKALKEAIAYPISPPGFQRKEYILCGQAAAEMLKCRLDFESFIHRQKTYLDCPNCRILYWASLRSVIMH